MVGHGGNFARNIHRLANSVRVRRSRQRLPRKSNARNPFRHLRLKARGRIFRPDGGDNAGLPIWLVAILAIVAIAAGYTIAVLGEFRTVGTLLAPFVLVALVGMFATRVGLGARILGVVFCVGFLLIAWWQ